MVLSLRLQYNALKNTPIHVWIWYAVKRIPIPSEKLSEKKNWDQKVVWSINSKEVQAKGKEKLKRKGGLKWTYSAAAAFHPATKDTRPKEKTLPDKLTEQSMNSWD